MTVLPFDVLTDEDPLLVELLLDELLLEEDPPLDVLLLEEDPPLDELLLVEEELPLELGDPKLLYIRLSAEPDMLDGGVTGAAKTTGTLPIVAPPNPSDELFEKAFPPDEEEPCAPLELLPDPLLDDPPDVVALPAPCPPPPD